MKSAQWNNADHTSIRVIFDDDSLGDVPPNELNKDYADLLESGITIDEYVAPPVALTALSPRQIRLALLSVGITEAMVDAALVGDDAGMIEWKHATQFNRNHALIDSLGAGFGLTDEQIDTLWLSALNL